MRKRHKYKERMKYMRMLEEGYSINFINKQYGISHGLLTYLWSRYKAEGPSALAKKRNCHLTVKEKLEVIFEYREKHLSLSDIMLNHGVSESAILSWSRMYDEGGEKALSGKPKGRPRKDMGRPKKKKPEEMTELERLRYENEYLRAENALMDYINYYNNDRIKLRLNGKSPVQYRTLYQNNV